jgi:hypothetical protein
VENLHDSGTKANEEAVARVKEIIDQVVPDDFLLRFFRVVTLAKTSRADADEMVGSLLRAFKAPRSVFGQHDFISVGVSIRNNKTCWDWIMEEIRKQVSANVYDKGIHYKMTSSLWRILSSNANGDIALAEIIRQRKAWWANEYIRRGKHNADKRVTYQIKARLFRSTHVEITEDGGARINYEHAALVGALNQSARAYLRKKRAFKFNVEQVVEPGNLNLDQYAALLDRTYMPTHTWTAGVLDYRRSVSYLVEDVHHIMQYVASGMDDTAYMPAGDLQDDEIGESDVDDTSSPIMVDSPEPSVRGDVEDEEMSDFDFGDGDDEDEAGENAGMVDLHGELEDECSYVPLATRTEVIAKHGRYVMHDEAVEIVKEVHKAYMISIGKNGQDIVGDDIEDV